MNLSGSLKTLGFGRGNPLYIWTAPIYGGADTFIPFAFPRRSMTADGRGSHYIERNCNQSS